MGSEAAILIAHIAGGVIGVAAGLTAVFSPKGAYTHRTAGAIFVAAMVVNGTTAAILGHLHADPADVFGGLASVYLVLTAWLTVHRAERRTGAAELGLLLVALTGAVLNWLGVYLAMHSQTGHYFGKTAPQNAVVAAVISLVALADLSVLLRRGIAGRQRIARHVSRMLTGFFIAIGSFFPGQIRVFPDAIKSFLLHIEPRALLFAPPAFVFVVMLYWLTRVYFTRQYASIADGPSG